MDSLLLLLYVTLASQMCVLSDVPSWTCDEVIGSCYYLGDIKFAHVEASCWCQSVGGRLAWIDSPAKWDLLRNVMTEENVPNGIWIAATDRRAEDHFVWSDSTEMANLPWWSYEPDNNGNQDCVTISDKVWWERPVQNLPDYLAFDDFCSSYHYPLCEKVRVPLESRALVERSRDQIYPTATLTTLTGITAVGCVHQCTETCGCLSVAYKRDGGHCILYNEYFSELTSPQISVGYRHYD